MAHALVIDNENHFLRTLKLNLRSKGFEVSTATNGIEGIKIAKEEKIDLILLDLNMPQMDGLEVLVELKSNEKTKEIRVIMLTAEGKIKKMDEAFELGADDYIVKRYESWELATIVQKKYEKLKE